MKAKKVMVVLCLMLGLVAFSLGTANAAFTYFTCTISATGATGAGAPYITVTDVGATFTDFTFILDNSAGQANACLAAALTAWANSGNVKIFINAPPANFDTCFSVAVVK